MTLKEHSIFSVWVKDYSNNTRLESQKLLESVFGSTATDMEISALLEKAYEARGMKRMFVEINKDCLLTQQTFTDFMNIGYYTEQIENIYEFHPSEANDYAVMMSEIPVEENYIFPKGFEYLNLLPYREQRENDGN